MNQNEDDMLKNPNKREIEYDEVEADDLKEELTDINEPFDPKDIEIQAIQTTLDTVIKRIEYDEIDLNPDFQRYDNLWNPQIMSRLIESLLIRLPIPAFYFDASDDEKWQVVDGLQRLSVIKKFVVDKKMKLTKLEFLKDYEGCNYDDLPRNMQRRIDETQITMYLIKPGTPVYVKFSLFYRINTGGLQLTPQEIRHALSHGVNNGQASKFLEKIVKTELFKEVGRVSGKRMLDKELILRYVAFRLIPYESYKPPMITFLNTSMETLGNLTVFELEELSSGIHQALSVAKELFGDDAFRKSIVEKSRNKVINRALFEVTSVSLSLISEEQIACLIKNKEQFLEEYKLLFEKNDFYASITYSTTAAENVSLRFDYMCNLIKKYSQI